MLLSPTKCCLQCQHLSKTQLYRNLPSMNFSRKLEAFLKESGKWFCRKLQCQQDITKQMRSLNLLPLSLYVQLNDLLLLLKRCVPILFNRRTKIAVHPHGKIMIKRWKSTVSSSWIIKIWRVGCRRLHRRPLKRSPGRRKTKGRWLKKSPVIIAATHHPT